MHKILKICGKYEENCDSLINSKLMELEKKFQLINKTLENIKIEKDKPIENILKSSECLSQHSSSCFSEVRNKLLNNVKTNQIESLNNIAELYNDEKFQIDNQKILKTNNKIKFKPSNLK